MVMNSARCAILTAVRRRADGPARRHRAGGGRRYPSRRPRRGFRMPAPASRRPRPCCRKGPADRGARSAAVPGAGPGGGRGRRLSSSALRRSSCRGSQGWRPTAREALLEEAISAFRFMLINSPELVRVRLELARAFFLKGEDDLSREQFERVLAGNPPAPVVANVRSFPSLRSGARRRWTLRGGFSLAPDTNIGATSEERIIYISGLPFVRDAEELSTSGIGLSAWLSGEYQYPWGDRRRLRAGADVSRRDYAGSSFDQTFVSVARRTTLAGRRECRGELAGQRAAALGPRATSCTMRWAPGSRPDAGSPAGSRRTHGRRITVGATGRRPTSTGRSRTSRWRAPGS